MLNRPCLIYINFCIPVYGNYHNNQGRKIETDAPTINNFILFYLYEKETSENDTWFFLSVYQVCLIKNLKKTKEKSSKNINKK